MPNIDEDIGTTRASRAGHTFHERWAARRSLQLVFPNDDLFAIAVEGISSTETASPGARAEEVADLVLYYGRGDTFQTCERLSSYRRDQNSIVSMLRFSLASLQLPTKPPKNATTLSWPKTLHQYQGSSSTLRFQY